MCSLRGALLPGLIGATAGSQAPISPHPQSSALNSELFVRDFGDYELLTEIARGGMGIVYKARQKSLDRIVALKLLLFGSQASPEFAKRFRAEAVLAASLQHPNIVAIHEVGVHEGQQFFAMDYVEGPSLARMVGPKPLPARRAAGYLRTVAEAIHYAHEHGILHRDLKPSNVLIDANDQPRVTDFGLARRFEGDSQVTLTGQVLGSPNYIPPEQALGKRGKVSRQSDVYALGAMLYHLLTGRPPFQGETLTDTLHQVLNTEPPAPRLLNPAIPRDLETICLKCLEKETPRRYPTAQALAEELARFLESKPIQARPVSAAGKAWKWCRRRPALAGLSAILVLTLVAGLTLALWQLQQTRTSELLAKQNAYAADMNLAQVAVESGDLGAAMALLDAHRPAPGQKDLRGWEWRYFWQRCRSDELFELTNSPVTIDQVLFTPDGRWLAARDERSNLTLWDIGSRRQVRTFKMHGYLEPFAFSQQSNLLAYVTEDLVVNVVSLDTLQDVAGLRHTDNIAHVAFSADASRLFSLDEHGTLTQWDIASTKPMRTLKFPGPQYGLDLLVFSPDASTVVYRLWIGLGLWEPDSGRHTQLRIDGAKSAATVLRFSPDGKWLAAGVGNSDSEVYVWALEDLWRSTEATPPPRVRFGPHRDQISAVAFSPNCGALVSASTDSTLRVWEFGHPKEGRRYQGHRHQVLSVAWSTDGHRIVSSGTDGSVRVWDPRREPALSGSVELTASPVGWSFRLSSDGKTGVAIERTNGAAVLWDMINMRPVEVLHFAGTSNSNLALSPDGRTMAVGDYHGKLTIWDLNSRRALTNLSFGGGWIGYLDFPYEGRFLFGGAALDPSAQHRVAKLWEVDGWREVDLPRQAMINAYWAAISPDTRTMVVLHHGGALSVWDIPTGRCRTRLAQPLVGPTERGYIGFSPDGRVCASSTQRGVLCLWDPAGRYPSTVLPRTTQELWNLSFTADGTRLLVSGKRSSDVVRLLDMSSKRFVASLPGKPETYWYVRMSVDNSTIYAVGEETVLLWRAPSWAEIEAAEKGQVAP